MKNYGQNQRYAFFKLKEKISFFLTSDKKVKNKFSDSEINWVADLGGRHSHLQSHHRVNFPIARINGSTVVPLLYYFTINFCHNKIFFRKYHIFKLYKYRYRPVTFINTAY